MISNPQGNISYKETRKKVVDSNPAVRELEETAKETMYTFTVVSRHVSFVFDHKKWLIFALSEEGK
jgi:hypothetical protein